MNRILALSLWGAALLLPSLASAQTSYPVSTMPSVYQPLPIPGAAAPPTVLSLGAFTNDGNVSITLPFPVTFFGNTKTQAIVYEDGWLGFQSSPVSSQWTNTWTDSAKNDLIAVWWDDIDCDTNDVQTQLVGAAPNREFVVQWHCFNIGNQPSRFQAQLWFTEGSTAIRVRYGTVGTGSSYSASFGLKNSTGTEVVMGPGANGATCGTSCSATNWPTNTTIQYGFSTQADLVPEPRFGAMTTVGGDITFPVNVTVRNLGLAAAAGLGYNIFLSTDAVLDANDTSLGNHPAVENVPSAGVVTFTDTVTTPRPPAGQYWVCVDLDPADSIVEANNGNNRACTPAPFLVGADLTGTIALQETSSAVGEVVHFPITIRNLGSDASGLFTYRVLLSEDDTVGGDLVFATSQITLLGTDTFTTTVTGRVPANAVGQAYYAILQIDFAAGSPNGVVVEANEGNNNIVTTSRLALVKPDLGVSANFSVNTQDPLGCFFGETITVSYEVCNEGDVPARGFVNSVLFSNDVSIDAPMPGLPFGDSETASLPVACDSLDSECGGPAGPGFCKVGFCHDTCVSDGDCATGLTCYPDIRYPNLGKTCQNILERDGDPQSRDCRVYSSTFTVPFQNENSGVSYAEGDFYIGIIPDVVDTVNEDIEWNNSRVLGEAFPCRFPKPDLQAATIIPPARIAAGESAAVFRTIRNLGNRDADAQYRYVLSTNETLSGDDITLAVQATGGDGRVHLGSKTESQLTDLVRIPAHVAAGEYFLGLLVDPANGVTELDETNNTFVATAKVRVERSSLRIVTTSLPDATVQAQYGMQLVAAGGSGTYQWSANPAELPPGMSLTEDGFFSGAPRDEGIWAFSVEVSSGGVSATGMLALRVLPPTGPLAITTTTLPTAVVARDYNVRIAASGGLPPYVRWERISGSLPSGITLDLNTGVLSGKAVHASAIDGDVFTVQVTDSRGNTATRQLALHVVDSADLFISSTNLREVIAGEEFRACLTAQGGSGFYRWSIDQATLPAGLGWTMDPQPTPEQVDDVSLWPLNVQACITGTTLACNSFTIAARVEDVRAPGVSDTAEIPLTVVCSRINLLTDRLADVKPGDTVNVQLEADAGQNPTFRVYAGNLPAGLTLDANGLLSGTVANDAAVGPYNFIVEIKDEDGGYGLEALTIRVVTPPVEKPVPTTNDDGGCSTAADGASGVLPFAVALIGLVAAGFRRRAAAFARVASFATVATVAGGAQAQSAANYTVTGPYDMGYSELENAVSAPASLNDKDWGSTTSDQWVVQLPSDFNFKYFGSKFGWLSIGGNGGIIPLNTGTPASSADNYVDTSPDAFPDTLGPKGIIAPWWDDFARGAASPHPGGLSFVIEGAAPRRVVKVQWKNLTHYDCQASGTTTLHPCGESRSYSWQAWIYEATGSLDSTIVFSYATPIGPDGAPNGGWPTAYAGSTSSNLMQASVGLEDNSESIGLTGLSCTPTCNETQFPAGKTIVFSRKADLAVVAVRGDVVGWAGVSMPVQAEVRNYGAVAAAGFTVQYFGSTDARLDARDILLANGKQTLAAAPGASVLFSDDVTLPADVLPGSYYVLAKVDPLGVVDDDVAANNVGVHGPFVVGSPSPDLTVETINAPTSANLGATFSFDWAVRNRGNARAVQVPYAVVISDNDVISASDRRLATGIFNVDSLTVAPVSVDVTLPANVQPGRYYLGIVIDPDDVVHEISEMNNVGVSADSFDALGGPLQVVGATLPAAQVGTTYCAELRAIGGNGNYAWAVANGSALPPGLAILSQSSRTSLLCGTPSQVGAFSFSVQVSSANETAVGALSLDVSRSSIPLAISSAELPTAIFNAPYAAQLHAIGGVAPYSWSLVSGTLPIGLHLGADGMLAGTPVVDGTATVTVQVVDAQENVATQQLRLTVTAPSRLTCVTHVLQSVNVGTALETQLVAAGGTRPYSFRNVEWRRLSNGIIDDGDAKADDAPPGLLLAGNGQVTGIPTVAGSYLWRVRVEDGARATDECLVQLDVTYEQGLTITTRTLAEAIVGLPYQARLQANVSDHVTWSLVSGSALPRGFELSTSGVISGQPDSSLLNGENERTFSFIVEARDAQNRISVASLSIKLSEPAVDAPTTTAGEDGGCQAAGAAPGLLGVAFALGLVSLRRRR